MLLSINLDMNEITTRIRSYFDNTILKRGWGYYTDGAVAEIKVEGAAILNAKVWGSSTYRVKIDLAAFSKSTCSCPYGGYCKHLAAVLFEACDLSGQDPKQLLRSPKPVYTAANMIPATAASSQAPITKPKETETIGKWHRYFEKQYSDSRTYSVHALDTFYTDAMRKMSPLAKNWQPLMENIYQLHLHLFILKQADAIYQNNLSSFYYYYDYSTYFKRISQQCLKQLSDLMQVIDTKEAQRQFPLHLAETVDFLIAYAFPEPKKTNMNWMSVYRLLWWDLLNQEQRVHKEQERIQAILGQKETGSNRDAFVLAAAHFDIMARRDDKAMNLLEEMQQPKPGALLEYLQVFTELHDWDRLLLWLKWLEPQMKQYGQGYLREYFLYWKEACRYRDREREYTQTAISLLPASYTYYAQRLLEQGSYQQWVDLCLAMSLSPLEISSGDLKLIESEHIGLLLPLYHHAAERHIQERNRDSYKIAVRLMKKLRQSYKKLKKQDRFTQYMSQISKRYSRLRALQEELRKGKLIE